MGPKQRLIFVICAERLMLFVKILLFFPEIAFGLVFFFLVRVFGLVCHYPSRKTPVYGQAIGPTTVK